MKPILIIKTKNGFAVMEYEGEVPTASLDSLRVTERLESMYSYSNDGLLSIVKAHFAPPPEVIASPPSFESPEKNK